MENNYSFPRNILEDYDVAGLMSKMAGADWYYDYTDDWDAWRKGLNEINDIKADLLQLSKMENGVKAGNYLWEAYVPVYSVQKPDFLIQLPQNNISTINISTMNENNLEYLKNNLKYHGFGEALNPELEKNIASGVTVFTLQHSVDFNNRKMDATLFFRKGDQNDMYFFNKYEAKLSKGDSKEFDQTIYIDKGKGFTIKEAFNLLDGRSVNKDMVNAQGQQYNAWVKLDFENKNENGNYVMQKYHENYGYNLEKALSNRPVKELDDPTQKDDLMRSLKKGNLQAVTDQNGERLFMTAEPESGKANKIGLYDKHFKAITMEVRNAPQLSKEVHQQSNAIDGQGKEQVSGKARGQKKESSHQHVKEEDLLPKSEKKKGKAMAKGSGDEDLLPKSRQSTGKGMKI